MLEVLLEALADSLKLIPFLLLTYLVMGLLERAASERSRQVIKKAGRFGPVWGGLLGTFPQCGFSAAASNFYIGRVITLGTLIAIYMSTSDEMLPILISEKVGISTIAKIMLAKIVIGMISGFLVEIVFGWMAKRNKRPMGVETKTQEAKCNCGSGIFVDATIHALKVFIFVFIISLAIGTVIHFVGQENLYLIFADIPVLGELIAAVVGLIPNCAASVVITQLYLDGIIGAGPMMSGLLVSAGVGLLVLFKENRHMKENITITVILFVISVAWGVAIEAVGITF